MASRQAMDSNFAAEFAVLPSQFAMSGVAKLRKYENFSQTVSKKIEFLFTSV
jgi:hypothetical protein